mmetsp:Transcript_31360/g.66781  ORF Transcript_31360/g.66781 Transcript_31360/m.66781 type:complete len:88 (-) Transcript_31360:72-335(-)
MTITLQCREPITYKTCHDSIINTHISAIKITFSSFRTTQPTSLPCYAAGRRYAAEASSLLDFTKNTPLSSAQIGHVFDLQCLTCMLE